jgi:hypothetical protein
MRPATAMVVVVSAALFALGAVQAAAVEGGGKRHALKAHHKVQHLMARAPAPAQARICAWVGPGGRAIYRCHDAAIVDFVPSDQPARRSCGWVGPGGRAVYRCQ